MEEVLEVLNDLASKGVKLSVEGDELRCYAPKGSLTNEVRDRIVRNKPKIIDRLRDYIDFQEALASSNSRSKAQRSGDPGGSAGKRRVPSTELPLDLQAEAILDTTIQPATATVADVDVSTAKAILLTGASGFLGAYLLHDLIAVTKATIYCLVRCRSESDGGTRIKNNLLKYGLWSDDFMSRIVPVPGDLAQPLLGVGAETFESLCNTIEIVFHNGAVVNFIYPYSSLKESNVRGTQEVLRLACRVRQKPLHYVSTIGVFPPAARPDAKVLESDIPVNWQGLTSGYPQSKWVAEKLVTIAADRGLPVRIYRPGFVTGDSSAGIWNTDDFLARMIKGCIQLGSAPDIDAMIEMVPVNYVSQAIVHLSRQRELRSNVFHVVGRRYIPVSELFRIIASLDYKITLRPYADWRKALFDDAKTSSNNALFPLLIGFTDGPILEMPAFDCSHTLDGLRGTELVCPEIDKNLMATYLAYFKSTGFLDA